MRRRSALVELLEIVGEVQQTTSLLSLFGGGSNNKYYRECGGELRTREMNISELVFCHKQTT